MLRDSRMETTIIVERRDILVKQTRDNKPAQKAWSVRGDDGHWEKQDVVMVKDGQVTLRDGHKMVHVVPVKEVLWANENDLQLGKVEDMTSLKHLHFPAILETLEERGKKNEPYTLLGTVLIGVNPIISVGDPLSLLGSAEATKKAHPYGIAERAYQQMTLATKRIKNDLLEGDFSRNQSIIVSGESGSGKSESCKRVLRHLVARSTNLQQSEFSELEKSLIEATAIFESFGNASTISNHNSSRFGKLIKIQFAKQRLAGAQVETYLLEKSRVTSLAPSERNFHVFYRMLIGLSSEMKEKLGIKGSANDFHLLQTVDVPKWIFQNDEKEFASLCNALHSFDCREEVQERIWSVLAAILHLGEVDVTTGGIDTPSLDIAARLLGISSQSLRELLTERLIFVSGERLKVSLNDVQIKQTRDSFIRSLYQALFNWVVGKMNRFYIESRHEEPELWDAEMSSIGVLDIFGFENFEKNGLEQVLINFTNEALQATFSQQVLIAEANLYKSEGLLVGNESQHKTNNLHGAGPEVDEEDVEDGQVKLNRLCMALFTSRKGLLLTVEDLSNLPQPSDNKLLQHLHKNFRGQPCYHLPNPRYIDSQFIINHFAGEVTYSIEGFVEKNIEKVPKDVVSHLLKSEDKMIVANLFHPEECLTPQAQQRTLAAPKQKGLCSKFSDEIKQLVADLEATNCSFIRCIKPNRTLTRINGDKNHSWFNRAYVARQMYYLAIPQTAEVLRQGGFPTRISFEEIYNTFQQALPKEALHAWQQVPSRSKDFSAFTRALFWAFHVPTDLVKFGLTKVFFRAGGLSHVQNLLISAKTARTEEENHVLARRFCLYQARIAWRRCFAKIKCCGRFERLLKRVKARANAAASLTRFLGCIRARKKFLQLRQNTIKIQSRIRITLAKRQLQSLRNLMSEDELSQRVTLLDSGNLTNDILSSQSLVDDERPIQGDTVASVSIDPNQVGAFHTMQTKIEQLEQRLNQLPTESNLVKSLEETINRLLGDRNVQNTKLQEEMESIREERNQLAKLLHDSHLREEQLRQELNQERNKYETQQVTRPLPSQALQPSSMNIFAWCLGRDFQ